MADLKITELAALAGVDLAAGDLLAIADISASETKKITVTDFLGNASTLIADATIPGAKILFGSAIIQVAHWKKALSLRPSWPMVPLPPPSSPTNPQLIWLRRCQSAAPSLVRSP